MIFQFRQPIAFGPLKQAKNSRSLYAKRSAAVALNQPYRSGATSVRSGTPEMPTLSSRFGSCRQIDIQGHPVQYL